MLRFIKLSEISEETIKEVSKDDVNKFTCYKCKYTDINKLYVLRVDKPIGNGQSEYVSDCYCEDCCLFDMLTEFGNTYYLQEECCMVAANKAKLMKMAGISKSEITKKILGI